MGATELAPGHQQVQVDKVPEVPSLEPGQWLSNLPIFLLFNTVRPPYAAFFCVRHWKEQDLLGSLQVGGSSSSSVPVPAAPMLPLKTLGGPTWSASQQSQWILYVNPKWVFKAMASSPSAPWSSRCRCQYLQFDGSHPFYHLCRRAPQAGKRCFQHAGWHFLFWHLWISQFGKCKKAICLWFFQVLWFGKPLRQELHFAHGSWIFQELLFGDALAQRDFSDPSVEGALGPEFIYNAKTASPRRIGFRGWLLMNPLLLRCWAATEWWLTNLDWLGAW